MKILATLYALVPAGYNPPSGGEAPPGMEGLNTVVTWVLWGVGAILFVLFVAGLVKAARSRSHGGEADVAAPIWPLVCAIALGAAGTIWNAITG